MRNRALAVFMVAGFLAVPGLQAGTANGRQYRQRERIRAGVRSDELTPREAARPERHEP